MELWVGKICMRWSRLASKRETLPVDFPPPALLLEKTGTIRGRVQDARGHQPPTPRWLCYWKSALFEFVSGAVPSYEGDSDDTISGPELPIMRLRGRRETPE